LHFKAEQHHPQYASGTSGFTHDVPHAMRNSRFVEQPWASLLVHGLKQIEGRNWSTLHRGALWIASASCCVPSLHFCNTLRRCIARHCTRRSSLNHRCSRYGAAAQP
jgi:hypothetical protein